VVPPSSFVRTWQRCLSVRNAAGLNYTSFFYVNSRAHPHTGLSSATSFRHHTYTSRCFLSERRDDGYPTHANWRKSAGNGPTGSVWQSSPLQHVRQAKDKRLNAGKGSNATIIASRRWAGHGWWPLHSDFRTAGHQPLSMTVPVIKSKTHYRLDFNQGCVTALWRSFKREGNVRKNVTLRSVCLTIIAVRKQ
jgi:hypothetical protein